MNVLCVIPARGGSKSIPRKNIREFKGKPLMVWTIAAALASKLITRVIVSTEDLEIAGIAAREGVEVIPRPMNLALDLTPDWPVFEHVLEWLDQEHYYPDVIVHLRCTTPNRRVETLDSIIQWFVDHPSCESLRSIRPASFSPYKMVHRDPEGWISPVVIPPNAGELWNMPRQLLPQAYEGDGYVDLTRPHVILEQKRMLAAQCYGWLIDEPTIDIDTEADLARAEQL